MSDRAFPYGTTGRTTDACGLTVAYSPIRVGAAGFQDGLGKIPTGIEAEPPPRQ